MNKSFFPDHQFWRRLFSCRAGWHWRKMFELRMRGRNRVMLMPEISLISESYVESPVGTSWVNRTSLILSQPWMIGSSHMRTSRVGHSHLSRNGRVGHNSLVIQAAHMIVLAVNWLLIVSINEGVRDGLGHSGILWVYLGTLRFYRKLHGGVVRGFGSERVHIVGLGGHCLPELKLLNGWWRGNDSLLGRLLKVGRPI